MSGQALIELQNISVMYGDVHALEDISITIGEGDFLGLVGPNGAGKTTLLKVILGLVDYCCGTIKVHGHPVHEKGIRKALRIGYVPQNTSLQVQNFPATVFEVVSTGRIFGGKMARRLTNEDYEKVADVLKIVDVYNLRERGIGELSGGQQQRVFIARALSSDPQLLALDEPTSGVDVGSQAKLYDLLAELTRKRFLTIVLSTHDLSVVSRLPNRVVCVNKTLFYHGETRGFFSGDQMAKAYGYPVKLMVHENHDVI